MTEDTQQTPLNGPAVRKRRKALGLTQKAVAQQMGVTDAAVSQWERGGGIEVKKLPQLVRVLKTTTDDLIIRDESVPQRILDSVTIIDKTPGNRVPLVTLRGLTGQNMATRKQEALSCDSTSPGIALTDNSIAFAIADQSMEPEYQIAEIVTVDHLSLEPGDHIIAHIKPENATVFRVFEFDGSDHCKLTPINPKFRVLRFTNDEWERDVDVLGVMIAHLRARRARNTT